MLEPFVVSTDFFMFCS